MISPEERDQRLRDINRRLREILSERAVIEQQWHGSPPLDASNALAALAEETQVLRQERESLQLPVLTPELAVEYANRAWDIASRIETHALSALRIQIAWLTRMQALILVLLLVDIVVRLVRP